LYNIAVFELIFMLYLSDVLLCDYSMMISVRSP